MKKMKIPKTIALLTGAVLIGSLFGGCDKAQQDAGTPAASGQGPVAARPAVAG